MRKILLQKATRIEGNAQVQIEIADGRVDTARFMVQDFRGFEKLVQGKAVSSVPHMVSRICGLCSTAHQVASLQAIEKALGIEAPAPVVALRQIAIWGEWIASHALSYFFLTMPDLLGAPRGLVDLMQEYPEIAREAFFIRQAGNRVVELLGGRAVHPIALGVGRFTVTPSGDDLEEVHRIATQVRDASRRQIDSLNTAPSPQRFLPFPTGHSLRFLSYHGTTGQEHFEAFDRQGEITHTFGSEEFAQHVSEMRADWSLAKFPYLADLGFPDGILLVGPLSRLFQEGGILEDPDLAGLALIERLDDPSSLALDDLDECRLLEIHWAAKKILSSLDELELSQLEGDAVTLDGSGKGIGVVEAPRGVLVHEYVVSNGLLERMRLLVATQFNNAYINLVLRDLAERHLDGDGLTPEGDTLIARCVRAFDPCLTCATH